MPEAKIITYGAQISAGTTAIPDNTTLALDISSTDAKDYVQINTSDSGESLLLTGGGSGLRISDNGQVKGSASNTFALLNEDGTATNPNICPRADDVDTGIGWAAADKLSLIAGGVEGVRVTEAGDVISEVAVKGPTKMTGPGGTTGMALAANNTALLVENHTGSSATKCQLDINSSGADGSQIRFFTAGTEYGGIVSTATNLTIKTERNDDPICLNPEDEGGVIVGGTIPAHKLQVQDGDLGIVTNSADDVAKSLVFTKSKNDTDGAHTAVDDDTVLGNIVFKGSDSTGAFEPGAKIRAQIVAGTIGDGQVPTELIFSTAPDSASAPLDALVISPEGYTYIMAPTNGARLYFYDGTTKRGSIAAFSSGLYYDTPDSNHDHVFRVTGSSTLALQIDATNAFTGILEATPSKALDVKNGASGGDILCYDIYTHDGGATSSDERMKENIVETPLGLDFVNSLEPVSYKWKDTEEVVEMRTVPATDDEPEHEEVANTYEAVEYTRTHHGLISQQVKQALTDAGLSDNEFAGYIYDSERDEYRLRYSEFIAPLIKAVQELSARVAELEAGD